MTFFHSEEIRYFYRRQGSGTPLVLLHGFSGDSASWLPLLPDMTNHCDAIAIDLPGHGLTDSPTETSYYTMPEVATTIIELLEVNNVKRANLLGYSMGGRLALYLALSYPRHFRSLILESASPGLETEALRRQRQTQDDLLAMRIEEKGIEEFVTQWENHPIFRSQARLPAAVLARQRAIRLAQNPTGLAGSLRGMGTGVQPNLWPNCASQKLPTLLLAGSLDTKFTAIARRLHTRLPDAQLFVAKDCGHNIHLECPEQYLAAILPWLAAKV